MRMYKCIKCRNKRKPCEVILNHKEIAEPGFCPIDGAYVKWTKVEELVMREEQLCELCGQHFSLCQC